MRPTLASFVALLALLAPPAAALGQSTSPPRPAPIAPAGSSATASATSPAAFPVPAVDGKPLSVPPGQRTVRLPMRLLRAESFYRERFAGAAGVRLTPGLDERGRMLTITSTRPGDAWSRAVLREDAAGTSVELTSVVRMSRDVIEGRGVPAVQVVLPPNTAEIRKQADSIDHLRRGP